MKFCFKMNKFHFAKLKKSDNPDVDMRGANLFREHLEGEMKLRNNRNSRRMSRRISIDNNSSNNKLRLAQQPVESILVCTGVYNPQNDLLFHVRKIFQQQQASAAALSANAATIDRNNNFHSQDEINVTPTSNKKSPVVDFSLKSVKSDDTLAGYIIFILDIYIE